MKNANKVLMAAIVTVVLTTVNYAKADGALLSPRAQGNQIHVADGSSINDFNLAPNRPAGNARAWANARSLVKTFGTNTIDLAHGPTPLLSPKDPRYVQASQALREVQIASLK